MAEPVLCLGSASPRRAELLHQLGLSFVVQTAALDEAPLSGESPLAYVERVALDKAHAVLAQPPVNGLLLPVLTADTAVVVEGEILGKPRDKADGLAMMAKLSGRSHQVYTGIALMEPGPQGRAASSVSISEVRFRPTSAQEQEAYWASGEPADKAGGYAIQGYAAAFISHLNGSFSGVMGLPLFETAELLRQFGVEVCDGWTAG